MRWLEARGRRDSDFETACQMWKAGVERYEYVNSVPTAIRVHFEDLVAQPEPELARLLQFLRLEASDGPSVTLTRDLAESDPDLGDSHRGLDPAGLDEPVYRSWSNEKQRTFRSICSETMMTVGYAIPAPVA